MQNALINKELNKRYPVYSNQLGTQFFNFVVESQLTLNNTTRLTYNMPAYDAYIDQVAIEVYYNGLLQYGNDNLDRIEVNLTNQDGSGARWANSSTSVWKVNQTTQVNTYEGFKIKPYSVLNIEVSHTRQNFTDNTLYIRMVFSGRRVYDSKGLLYSKIENALGDGLNLGLGNYMFKLPLTNLNMGASAGDIATTEAAVQSPGMTVGTGLWITNMFTELYVNGTVIDPTMNYGLAIDKILVQIYDQAGSTDVFQNESTGVGIFQLNQLGQAESFKGFYLPFSNNLKMKFQTTAQTWDENDTVQASVTMVGVCIGPTEIII